MDDQNTQEPFRRRLGRGLSALIGTGSVGDSAETGEHVDQSEIHHELIERNPFQPRVDFDQTALNELVDSIRQHGVLQPLLVRQMGDGYQLIAGERRLIAARRAGLEMVPCRVLNLNDQEVCEVALEENLKRQDLGVLEKAQAFKDYLERFQCTIEELARRLSLDRSTVSNLVRLLELPDGVKDLVRGGEISGGHARAMLSLPTEQQLELCCRIREEGLSVRKTEEAVRHLQQLNHGGDSETVPFPREKPAPAGLTAHVQSLQDQLQQWLGAKVEIKLKGKKQDTGKITIEFGSTEDFERIVGRLQRAA